MAAADEKKQDKRVIIVIGVALLIAGGGYLAYPHINEYLESRVDPGEYKADTQGLAKLEKASLASNDDKVTTGDWPQWLGPHRDGIARTTGLLAPWPAEGPPVLWKIKGGPGFSCLAVAKGVVYTMLQDGPDEAVLCLDEATGKELWRHRYPGHLPNQEVSTYFGGGDGGGGPRSTPTVYDGKVYTVGSLGMFHCLDAASGKVLWQHDLWKDFEVEALKVRTGGISPGEYGTSFSPLIEKDLVITMPGGKAGHAIAAFDRNDGKLVWKAFDDRPGYSSPVAGTLAGKRQVVCLTAENVMGITPADGKLLWKHPWPSFKDCNVATPLLVGDYVFISSGYNKGCTLLEIGNKADGTQEAKPVYQHNRMRNHFSTSVLHQDHLYGFDEAWLVCMALRTGKVLWKQRGFQKGAPLIAGGRLIVLGEDGALALADPSPEGFKQLSSFRATTQRCWTMPIVANGKLFVRDQESIICLDVRGPG